MGTDRSNFQVLTRRSGVFWGLVLIVIGLVFLLWAEGAITLSPLLALALLFMLAGFWLVIVKLLPEWFK